MRVLFNVEGFTDIRFVTGLSEISDLTLLVSRDAYRESGLRDRVIASGARVRVVEMAGGRLAFQLRSLPWLLRHARQFDVVISLEMLRGSLNATVAGALTATPVVTYMGIDPVAYYRCRRLRRQVGPVRAILGEALIRLLLRANGHLATRSLTVGPYLETVARRYSTRTGVGLMYGVDTDLFRPALAEERVALRGRLALPGDTFVILNSSRVSHEKDPETVLRAVAHLRSTGVPALLLNLGGGFRDFLALAHRLGLPDVEAWVIGRPAEHPMGKLADYYRAADATAQGSLAEGCGYSPLESLACGTPAVATAVGGLARNLPGLARLVPPGDPVAMAEELRWIAMHPAEARADARRARDVVVRDWSRTLAFSQLETVLREVARGR